MVSAHNAASAWIDSPGFPLTPVSSTGQALSISKGVSDRPTASTFPLKWFDRLTMSGN